MREANTAFGSSSNQPKRTGSKARCSKDVCYGPHLESECWSKPENAKKKEDFLARRNAERQSQPASSSATTIKGRKRVVPPSANVASLEKDVSILSLHASYEDVSSVSEDNYTSASSAVARPNNSLWELHDTGATHCMFNNLALFDKSSLKAVTNTNRRLKLAGGGVSLTVHSEGTVRLKAGDGTHFELKDCLYIPELSKNLIAGGKL